MFRRDLVTRVALALTASAGLYVAWSQAQQPAELTLQKVTDDLYVIMGSGENVAFLPTKEGVVLIDDKFAQDGPQIQAKVKSVTEQPIKYVINTHQHGDHTGGNAALLGAGAEILIHKNARANMAKAEMPGIPRITFSDESQVFLGGKEVDARYFGRGHTNGDVMIYFPAQKVLHTGDLFTNGAPYCDTSANCSIKEWDKTIQKALASNMDFDTVIPGHGPVMKRADLAKYAQTVASVRDRIASACKGGADTAAQRLSLADLGFPQVSPMVQRGLPGMCKELAQ